MTRPTRMTLCANCPRSTRSISGLCAACQPKKAARPEVPCSVCGIRTTAKGGICPSCNWVPIGDPTPADELKGGRWVNENGIQRWRKWTDEECAERSRRALEVAA